MFVTLIATRSRSPASSWTERVRGPQRLLRTPFRSEATRLAMNTATVWRQARSATSRAVREKQGVEEFYYPREWYSQKENVELSMYTSPREWKSMQGKRTVGKSVAKDEKRDVFWHLEQTLRSNSKHREEETGMFFLPFLDWSVREGCKPFLSPEHVHKLYTDIHRTHVDELTRHVAGTSAEAAPLDVLVKHTAFDATSATINFHASMHWNMLFCWKTVVPYGSVEMPIRIRRALWESYNTRHPVDTEVDRSVPSAEEELQQVFTDAAMDMVGNGFVWLVWNPMKRYLEVRTTDAHTCPTVLGLTPLLGLNLWENAIAPGYGMNKLQYVKRFWHCIDWTWADFCYGLIQGDQELTIEPPEEGNVHVFPTQVGFRDEMMRMNQARGGGGRFDPLEAVKREWEAWRKMRINEDPGLLTPGTKMAKFNDQKVELAWKQNQAYHILGSHTQLNFSRPKAHNTAWIMTRRYLNQLGARAVLRRTEVFPPLSGILIPEEKTFNVISSEPEDPEDIEEFGEDSEMPWKEMREKWFHSNTHENELDFWKKRANTTDKSALYYGNQMGIV